MEAEAATLIETKPWRVACCGAKVLELVVREFPCGRKEWGYACGCGEIYEPRGLLRVRGDA